MTTFVNACLSTMSDSAAKVDRRERTRPSAARMIKALSSKTNVLITTHLHPDPDALASCLGILVLLKASLKHVKFTVRLKGQIGGGINSAFTRIIHLDYEPWDDETMHQFDAIVLLDTQPAFSNSPLPPGVMPTAVLDHHRGRGRRAVCAHSDIRINVGATASIVFSYFMEQHVAIPADLAATLLYAIESDLAGAAGQQGGLDTIAISSLTLLADTRRLYQMRYVDLPQSYYGNFAEVIRDAQRNDDVIVSAMDHVVYAETPAVMADFLLRCEGVKWTLVTAVHEGRLVFSLRTQSHEHSAGEIARRIIKGLGDGGGHLTKAGGAIPLDGKNCHDVDTYRKTLRRRLLRCLGVTASRGTKLV